jgi:galactose mutarotase-like enzyme
MSVRAKFFVSEKAQTADQGGGEPNATIKLRPVIGGDNPENAEFYKWTPTGEIVLSIVNKVAAEQFELGKQYYVDFTPA